MPTGIGILFVLAGGACWLMGETWLVGLLILSSFFEAASAIDFGSSGIQPYFVIACFVIASQMRKPDFWRAGIDFKGKVPLLLLGCVGILSAFSLPFLFAGAPVLSPGVGIDRSMFYQPPLQFGMGNVAQAAYLLINLLTVYSIGFIAAAPAAKRFYQIVYSLLLLLIFVEFALVSFGIPIHAEFFQNNPGYAIANSANELRVTGTFTEASEAGLALVMFFAGAFYEYFARGRHLWIAILSAVSLGLVRSTAALGSMLLIVILVCAAYPFYRFPWTIRPGRLVKVLGLLVSAVWLIAGPVAMHLAEFTIEKGDTFSYLNRTAADRFALQLAAKTYFLGVGLGSNRPSSLFTSLLSNVGIIGTVIFFMVVVRVGQNARGPDTWLRWAITAGVLDMCFGVPDINQPLLWIYLGLAAYYGACGVGMRESAAVEPWLSRLTPGIEPGMTPPAHQS